MNTAGTGYCQRQIAGNNTGLIVSPMTEHGSGMDGSCGHGGAEGVKEILNVRIQVVKQKTRIFTVVCDAGQGHRHDRHLVTYFSACISRRAFRTHGNDSIPESAQANESAQLPPSLFISAVTRKAIWGSTREASQLNDGVRVTNWRSSIDEQYDTTDHGQLSATYWPSLAHGKRRGCERPESAHGALTIRIRQSPGSTGPCTGNTSNIRGFGSVRHQRRTQARR